MNHYLMAWSIISVIGFCGYGFAIAAWDQAEMWLTAIDNESHRRYGDVCEGSPIRAKLKAIISSGATKESK